jgi:hypothetical protein
MLGCCGASRSRAYIEMTGFSCGDGAVGAHHHGARRSAGGLMPFEGKYSRDVLSERELYGFLQRDWRGAWLADA